MLTVKINSVDHAREMAYWLNKNISPGDTAKPGYVSAISRVLYWYAKDKSWELKYAAMGGKGRIEGLTPKQELLFQLRF